MMRAIQSRDATPPALANDRLLELTAAGVACQLTGPSIAAPEQSAYEIAIANAADGPVVCCVYALDRKNREVVLGELRVARRSCSTSMFSISPSARRRAIFVRLTGDGLDVRAQAPALVRRFSRALRLGFASIALGGLMMSALATTVVFGRSNARTLAASSVATPIVIALAAKPAPRPARVAFLTARRESDGNAASILASYLAVGERGTLRVFAENGALVGSAAFSHVGTSRVTLAPSAAHMPLRVRLDVDRGRAAGAGAEVELPAEPLPTAVAPPVVLAVEPQQTKTPTAAATAQRAALPAIDESSLPQPGDPFAAPDHAIAGRAFTVRIVEHFANMHVALQDQIGTSLDEVDVPPDAASVTLTAPAAGIVETYYLEATFGNSVREDTVVRGLRVYPR